MFYLTDDFACEIGCGMRMVFLKDIGTSSIFLYCAACGVAHCRLPSGPPSELTERLLGVEEIAPNGIAFPTREEIAATGLVSLIELESNDTALLDDLWDLLAHTAIKRGEYQKALNITTKVLSTWHGPPAIAAQLHSNAKRLLAKQNDELC